MKAEKWDISSIHDQKDRVVVVTGSTSGIGLETARVLAGRGATTILAVRNTAKGVTALEKITNDFPNADVQIMKLDLADLASVAAFADTFRKIYSRLDLLINNAGVMTPPFSRTNDGFELQFGTNHLGHFALTVRLFNLILRTPGSRIINVSSLAHSFGNIDFKDLNWEKRKYKKWNAYGDSKIANLYFTYELQKRLIGDPSGVTVAAAHPGWTATELQRHTGTVSFLNYFFAQKTDMGALPSLYAATVEGVKSGDFYGPSGFMEMKGSPRKVTSSHRSRDEAVSEKLWEASEALTGVRFSIDNEEKHEERRHAA